MLKDLAYALEFPAQAGTAAPSARLARERSLDAMVAGDGDWPVIAEHLAQEGSG